MCVESDRVSLTLKITGVSAIHFWGCGVFQVMSTCFHGQKGRGPSPVTHELACWGMALNFSGPHFLKVEVFKWCSVKPFAGVRGGDGLSDDDDDGSDDLAFEASL